MARILPAIAAALGAACMYWLDPQRGRRRRALLRDRLTRARARFRHGMGPVARDSANRLKGIKARATSSFTRGVAGDDVLMARVRSTLGRYVSHPGAIGVTVSGSRVMLSGDVLRREHDALLRAVAGVSGVMDVDDRLHVHERAERISALQGGRMRHGRRPELLQDNWAPATRALVGTAGIATVVYGIANSRLLATAAGALMLLRSAANRPLLDFLSARGPGAIRVQKTVVVDAPVDRVYATLLDYDNFPQFMSNVRSVEVRSDGTSHWTIQGPAGLSIEWDAMTTRMEENRLVAWATVDDGGSSVSHEGVIRLASYDGKTRVHVTMTYTPIAGIVGRLAAVVLGGTPEAELGEDLQRMKAFLESDRRTYNDSSTQPA